jgi:hypothetical protein
LREWISIGRDVWSARSLRDVFISMFGAPRPKGIAVGVPEPGSAK